MARPAIRFRQGACARVSTLWVRGIIGAQPWWARGARGVPLSGCAGPFVQGRVDGRELGAGVGGQELDGLSRRELDGVSRQEQVACWMGSRGREHEVGLSMHEVGSLEAGRSTR